VAPFAVRKPKNDAHPSGGGLDTFRRLNRYAGTMRDLARACIMRGHPFIRIKG
jgi:hypothetical protein